MKTAIIRWKQIESKYIEIEVSDDVTEEDLYKQFDEGLFAEVEVIPDGFDMTEVVVDIVEE